MPNDSISKSTIKKTQTQQPKTRPKQVVAKEGQIKKQPFWRRMKNAFFVKDIGDVGKYLWKEVIHPAIKKLLVDSSTNAINMAVYGETRARQNGQTHVSQSSVYANANRNQYNRGNRYQNIMEGMPPCDRELLEDILIEVTEELARNGKISVMTFSQILPGALAFNTVYTDTNWGWTDLNYNCIVQVPGGYILDMPPAKPI